MSKFCTKCGYKNIDEAGVCEACGSPFEPIQSQNPTAEAYSYTVSENASKRSESSGHKAVRITITCFLCVFLLGFASASSALLALRNYCKPENLSQVIENVDVMSIKVGEFGYNTVPNDDSDEDNGESSKSSASADIDIDEIDIDSIDIDEEDIDELKEYIDENGDDVTVADVIYRVIPEEYIEEYDITPETITEIYEESTAKEAIAEKVSDYMEYVTTEQGSASISTDEVIDLIKENKDLIKEKTGFEVSEKQYKEIEEYLDESEILDTVSFDSTAPVDREILVGLKLITSDEISIVYIVLTILTIAGIFMLNFHHMFTAFLSTGITFTFISIPLMCMSALTGVIELAFNESNDATAQAIATFITPLLNFMSGCGFVFLGLGVVCGSLSVVFYMYKKKRKMLQATTSV